MLVANEFTEKHCGGDVAKHRALRREIRKDGISWDDMVLQAAFLPALEAEAGQEIVKYVGYLPDAAMYLPHEPFIKDLIQKLKHGAISRDEYETVLNEHTRHLVADDMKKGGWIDDLSYTIAEFKAYMNYLPQFANAAQERIAFLLGFEPCLESSLKAELLMREQLATNVGLELTYLTAPDAKILTIIRYRMMCMNQRRAGEQKDEH